jgi:hypothetical protein
MPGGLRLPARANQLSRGRADAPARIATEPHPSRSPLADDPLSGGT